MTKSAKVIVYISFTINTFLTIFGFVSLHISPYTGLRILTNNHKQAYIIGVDKGSPADSAGIQPNDIILAIEGENISYLAFSKYSIYINSRKDLYTFWEEQKKLNNIIIINKPLNILIERDYKKINVSLIPKYFSFIRVLLRVLHIYLLGWTFVFIAYLVLRKKVNEISVINFIINSFMCASFVSFSPYIARDISFPFVALYILITLSYISITTGIFVLIHLGLIFPYRKKIIIKYPYIIKLLYGVLLIILFLHFARVFENTYITSYFLYTVFLGIFIIGLIYNFFKERNYVLRRQIEWVVFGFIVGLSVWFATTSIPILFGYLILPQEISLLFLIVIPISFAFAITRYRLMDIENIFDSAVIYTFTIMVIELVELGFLGIISKFYPIDRFTLPYISLITIIIIIAIYAPIRDNIKSIIERLFNRGVYDINKEIQNFIMEFGLSENKDSVLDKFLSFVEKLLAPTRIYIIKRNENKNLPFFYSNSNCTESTSCKITELQNLWNYFDTKKSSSFGFELIDKGILNKSDFNVNIENAIFVPLIAGEKVIYIAVLFERKGKIAYSKKDKALLDSISVDIIHILEAEESKKAKQKMEKDFENQRNYVVEEMHDGLGNILTNITVASQVAKHLFYKDKDKAKEMIDIMSQYSNQAMNFLRTGLGIINNINEEFGVIISNIKYNSTNLLEVSGINVGFSIDDSAAKLKLDTQITLNIVRCIQESLNNIMKHSKAKNVDIKLYIDNNNLNVIVSDDGIGFDITEYKETGLGLKNICKRMENIGGFAEIKSFAEKGTTVKLTIPI